MNDKDMQIIEVGTRLFARKGFAATTIQEISSECRISKGAFYLHFNSKEALLLAILKHHFDLVERAIGQNTSNIQSPRVKLLREQMVLYSHFFNHRELFVMLVKEQAIPRNETIKQLLFEKQTEYYYNLRRYIIEIYGQELEPFSWDLTIILEGMLRSYMGVLLFSSHVIEIKHLTEFILNRLDSMVTNIHEDRPFLTQEKTESILTNFVFSDKLSMSNILINLEEEIEKIGEDKLIITLQVLKEEIEKENYRFPVIQGMLSNFYGYPTLDTYRLIILKILSNK